MEADPGAAWRPLRASSQAGYRVVVATNQSGIGRGLFDMATLNAIHDKMHARREPGWAGASTPSSSVPHAADSACRVPQTQAGHVAARSRERFNVDAHRRAGDRRFTCATCRPPIAVGAQPILVLTGKGTRTREAGGLPDHTRIYPDLATVAAELTR